MTWDPRDLDFERAWRGGALLPPRASGDHPLALAQRGDVMERGEATDHAKGQTQKQTRSRAPEYYKRLAARDVKRQKESHSNA